MSKNEGSPSWTFYEGPESEEDSTNKNPIESLFSRKKGFLDRITEIEENEENLKKKKKKERITTNFLFRETTVIKEDKNTKNEKNHKTPYESNQDIIIDADDPNKVYDSQQDSDSIEAQKSNISETVNSEIDSNESYPEININTEPDIPEIFEEFESEQSFIEETVDLPPSEPEPYRYIQKAEDLSSQQLDKESEDDQDTYPLAPIYAPPIIKTHSDNTEFHHTQENYGGSTTETYNVDNHLTHKTETLEPVNEYISSTKLNKKEKNDQNKTKDRSYMLPLIVTDLFSRRRDRKLNKKIESIDKSKNEDFGNSFQNEYRQQRELPSIKEIFNDSKYINYNRLNTPDKPREDIFNGQNRSYEVDPQKIIDNETSEEQIITKSTKEFKNVVDNHEIKSTNERKFEVQSRDKDHRHESSDLKVGSKNHKNSDVALTKDSINKKSVITSISNSLNGVSIYKASITKGFITGIVLLSIVFVIYISSS